MVRSFFRNLSGSSGGMERHGLDEIEDTGLDVFFLFRVKGAAEAH